MTPSTAPLPRSPLQTIRALRQVLARQGAIVASWRTYNGRKLGPYYRLAYRAEGRQCSLYLGKSSRLVRQARRLLEKIQKTTKTQRMFRNAQRVFQKYMRRHQARFRIQLLQVGLQLRGYAVRGWRRWRARLRSQGAPLTGGGILRQLSVRLDPRFLRSNAPPHPPNNGSSTSKLPVSHPC
ncbi:MAG: hypothetical protein JXB10_19560 [Pirellulales bacterium]|nr:hypothetical protein [Pirellulales bacterium]